MICIWCKGNFAKLSREHIIPEAVGGNEQVVLEGAVCPKCNNSLARLDLSLAKQFEIVAFIKGIRGKGGKSPVITNWAPIAGFSTSEGEEIHLNAGPGVVSSKRKILPAARKHTGIYDVQLSTEQGKVTFKQEFGNDPNFLRAIYKIGLNLVARFHGPDTAADDAYDHVRKFVWRKLGEQPMTAAMEHTDASDVSTGFSVPMMREGSEYPIFQVSILGVRFIIDMHPQQVTLESMGDEAKRTGVPFYTFPLSLFSK